MAGPSRLWSHTCSVMYSEFHIDFYHLLCDQQIYLFYIPFSVPIRSGFPLNFKSGIGYALAKEFLKAGDNVVICSRSGTL